MKREENLKNIENAEDQINKCYFQVGVLEAKLKTKHISDQDRTEIENELQLMKKSLSDHEIQLKTLHKENTKTFAIACPSRKPIEAGVLFGAVYRGELVTDGFENMDCGAVQAVERVGGAACASAEERDKGPTQQGSEPAFAWRESGKPFRKNHPQFTRPRFEPRSPRPRWSGSTQIGYSTKENVGEKVCRKKTTGETQKEMGGADRTPFVLFENQLMDEQAALPNEKLAFATSGCQFSH
uniref:Uncharacterized protein n=1 Tax=Timema bartmani TaxID=61472 RepID=A0A7R9I1D2_9NEOP|nr:unnamed protein product [Timema bartmani]